MTRTALGRYESSIQNDLRDLDRRLETIRTSSGVDCFAMDEAMYRRSVDIAMRANPVLESFDTGILASVLVTGARLRDAGENDVVFATLARTVPAEIPKRRYA